MTPRIFLFFRQEKEHDVHVWIVATLFCILLTLMLLLRCVSSDIVRRSAESKRQNELYEAILFTANPSFLLGMPSKRTSHAEYVFSLVSFVVCFHIVLYPSMMLRSVRT